MIQHSHKDVFGKVRALIAPNLPLTTVSSGVESTLWRSVDALQSPAGQLQSVEAPESRP